MGRRVVQCVIFILLGLFLCSGSNAAEKEETGQNKELVLSSSISTTKNDITTPIPTVPTITPTTPVVNPAIVNPDSPPAITNPSSSSGSWCVASQSASQTALQVALDYACGYGGAECSAIQPSGSCYNPSTIHDHASYAFNNYYQKNPVPTSCNFGGTAVITNTDPSSGTCQYQSTSTSSSILNTTNSSGSTVFGAGPANPTSSEATVPNGLLHFFISTCLMMLLARNHL
uniref:Putative glucan endo-1,3-beta-glucosidase 12-like isoform X2 n=1 Tax=Davidia involucrata TaxID=16924 RepID=A0A5B7BC20_DAVIN